MLSELEVIGNPTAVFTATAVYGAAQETLQKTLPLGPDLATVSVVANPALATTQAQGPYLTSTTSNFLSASLTVNSPFALPFSGSGSVEAEQISLKVVPDASDPPDLLSDVTFGSVAAIYGGSGTGSTTSTVTYDAGDSGKGTVEASLALSSDGYQSNSATISDVPLNTVITLTYAFSANVASDPRGHAPGVGDMAFWGISSPPTIGVTATPSNLGGGQFGPYLSHVRLPTVFTATLGNNPGTIAGVDYSVDGKDAAPATPSGSGRWQFDPNVGGLDPGNHVLTVTAVDWQGNPVLFEGNPVSSTSTIVVTNTLNFSSLTTTYGGGTGPVDTSHLRFISGIPLTPTFLETVSDIPSYYANSTEFPDVELGGTTELITWATPAGTAGDTFTFTHNVKTLAPGQTDVELLTPVGDGLGVPFPSNTDYSYLYAIALPTWMGTPTSKSFGTGDDVQKVLGVGGGYVINLSWGLGAKVGNLPATSGTPEEFGTLFNGLNSSASTGFDFSVYATLDDDLSTSKARIVPQDWSLFAQFLGGQDLLNSNVDLSSLDGISVQGALDPSTLAEPTQIIITATDIDLASLLNLGAAFYDLPFGTQRSFTLPVAVPILGFLNLSLGLEMNLEGDFHASLDSLTADAELAINLKGGSLTLDPSQSYFDLSAQGTAKVNFVAQAALKGGIGIGAGLFTILNVGDFRIIRAAASGSINAAVDLFARFDLKGDLLSPDISYDDAQSYGTATLSGKIGYDWSFLSQPDPPPSTTPIGPTTFTLFGHPPTIQASLSDPSESTMTGPGTQGSPGYQGVPPTSNNALDLLGPASSGGGLSTNAIAPTSTLSIHPTIDGGTTDIQFDLNVLAAQSQLASGHHFLEALLVDPQGDDVPLTRIDLASLALSANANPLGYASGWSTIDVRPPTGQMDPTLPYQLVFQFTDDLAGTGQSVAVALDNLRVTGPTPALGVTTPGSSLAAGVLAFGAGTGGSTTATVRLQDTGTAPLIIDNLSIVGAGFYLPGGGVGPIALDPGDTFNIPVQLLETDEAASGTLRVASNDPNQATYSLPLSYDGQSLATVVPRVASFLPVASPRHAAVAGVDVNFNQAIDPTTFDWHDLSLTLDGGPNLITGEVTVSHVAGSTYAINGLSGLTAAQGDYMLSVAAAGVRNGSGLTGSGSMSTSWLMDTTAPTSTVSPLPKQGGSLSFVITVSGKDPSGPGGAPASGVSWYDIYSSTNGGAWSLWTSVPASSPSATFAGQSSTTYAFYSVAYDAAGNVQSVQPGMEASTYLGDLTPPMTSVDPTTGKAPSSVAPATGTFTLNLSGTAPGGKPLADFRVYVAIDAQEPVPIGPAIPAGFPDSQGMYHATITYQGLTDGISHSYRFYSLGIDGGGLAQTTPVNPVAFNNHSFTAGALQVTALTVENGAAERSYIRYLGVDFNESDSQSGGALTGIVDSLATSRPGIRLFKYDLYGDASTKTAVSLSGASASVIDHAIEIDFGASGIGGNANTTAGDGYYELDVTFGSMTYEHHFDRLLGDVTGDGAVDNNDLTAIASELALSSPTGYTPLSADVNGDGTVAAFDVTLATRAKGHKLGSGLSLG